MFLAIILTEFTKKLRHWSQKTTILNVFAPAIAVESPQALLKRRGLAANSAVRSRRPN